MPYLPSDDPNLQAWFKADALALSNNDPVSPWTGSILSRNLTAFGSPTFKTNIQNGLPAVLFDGVDDYFDGSFFAAIPQPWTISILGKSTTWQRTLLDSSGGNRNILQTMAVDVNFRMAAYAGNGPVIGTANLSAVAPVILTVVFNGANSRSYVNGVADIAADLGSLSFGAGPRFGATVIPSDFFSGYAMEMLFFSGAKSEVDLAQPGNYYADKWAATWSGLALVPVITSALTASGIYGQAFSYQITATNQPTSYAATGLPTGLSVNTGTGAITGTPTVPGVYSVTIQATNAAGTDSETLVITVREHYVGRATACQVFIPGAKKLLVTGSN